MSTQIRKIEIRQANEALILEAAEKIFAINGYKGAATGDIAREAGIPKANLHYYFKTKSILYREVLKHILDDWMAAASTFDIYHEPEEALRTYVKAKMEFSRQRPFGSRVWASEIMSGAPVLDNFLSTTLKAWLNERVSTIRRWAREEKIKSVDPHALMFMIWATTQHYADFERQIIILNGGKELSDRRYRQRTDEVVKLVLGTVGL
ncbi:MAG: TetR family transcriptional regulator C-terminal domain-containing protein [Proteobacteria bacterium]|nr:TetR family transcriptional regulator C-terminal domain-containing protein [Pseudomonadota bacterium]